MMNLNEPGRAVREIFENFPSKSENSESSLALETGTFEDSVVDSAKDVDGISVSGHEVGMLGAGHKDAANQTDEFDYIHKTLKERSFDEDYFQNDDEKCRFYTGLPCFDVLKKTFNFVFPFVKQRSASLNKFQEFILVLIKLRINVPY